MFLTIEEAAKYLNVAQSTLRRWEDEGKIIPTRTSGGHRRYDKNQLNELLVQRQVIPKEDKFVVGYCRVSSSNQKDDLNRQIDVVSNYCSANGYQFKIITDVGSGLNYSKKGLNELLELICTNKIKKVVINYKDRLVRNGYEMLETICKLHDVQIEVINLTENSNEQELVEDVLAIITVYSAKLYGSRSHKNKTIVDTNKSLFAKKDE